MVGFNHNSNQDNNFLSIAPHPKTISITLHSSSSCRLGRTALRSAVSSSSDGPGMLHTGGYNYDVHIHLPPLVVLIRPPYSLILLRSLRSVIISMLVGHARIPGSLTRVANYLRFAKKSKENRMQPNPLMADTRAHASWHSSCTSHLSPTYSTAYCSLSLIVLSPY